MVRNPSVVADPVDGIAPPASGGKTTLPVAIASFSRFVHSLNLSLEGATPDTPMKGAPGMRTPGSWSEVAKLFSIFHLTMNGVKKTSGRNPNPGTIQVKANGSGRMSTNSTSRRSPGFAPLMKTGPVNG